MSHNVDITVHHLNIGTCPPSPTDLLDRARGLVDAAAEVSHWRSVKAVAPPELAASMAGCNAACYVWAKPPPSISLDTTETMHIPELEEWDAPLDETVELSDSATLREFESTEFEDVLRPKSRAGKRKSRSRSSSPSPMRRFADDVDVNDPASRLSKRRREYSTSTHISISTLIPFPHYCESPDPACPPPPEIERIPAFRIAKGISMTLPYARTAWLVPLRGCPPFEGASSAVVCSSSTSKPPPLPPDPQLPICIQWTPPAISQFWTFLLRQRSMNNFGPLSFSYSFGPLRQGLFKDKQRSHSSNNVQQAQRIERANEWEYVKIYHDGQYALKFRSLLDSFRWDDEKYLADTSLRNRVLKGARLVLMDECGDTMLLA